MVTGPGAAALRQRDADQRPRQDRPRPGAVHAVLRRRDRRHRRRPDRLLPRRRARAAGPQRRQHRRGRAPAPRGRARRRAGRRPPHRLRRARACRAPRSDEVLTEVGLPVGHDYMSFVEAELRRRRRRRVPHRLHRRARLRAGRRAPTRPAALWDALLAAGEPHGMLPVRPRRPRHAAHRDGLPAPRPGHHPRRHARCRRGSAGRWAGRRSGSGAARCCWPRRRPGPERLLRGLRRHRPGHPAAGHAGLADPRRAAVRGHLRHLQPDAAHRASGWRWCRPWSTRTPRWASTSAAGARSSSWSSRRSSTPASGSPDAARPAAHVPLAGPSRAPLVVASRGRRRRGGRRRPTTWPASGSPARPMPSRGSGRPGPSSPTTASTR